MPANWQEANRPYDRRLLDAALELLDAALGLLADLVPSQGEQVLVNQDLHAGNVLRATGSRGWSSTRSRWSASGSSRGADGARR